MLEQDIKNNLLLRLNDMISVHGEKTGESWWNVGVFLPTVTLWVMWCGISGTVTFAFYGIVKSKQLYSLVSIK